MKSLILLSLLFLISCGEAPKPPAPTTVTTDTGIYVTSMQTLSLGHLAEIDRQCEDLYRIAQERPNEYEVFPFCGKEIHIFIVAKDGRCDGPQGPGFVITQIVPRGTNYDGTEFDLDGQQNGSIQMCVAGRYHPSNQSIEVTADGIVQTDIVRYELEHWLLRRIDPERYVRTLIHGAGTGHPILGDGSTQKALAPITTNTLH